MDTDLALILGLLIGAFSLPAILSSVSDGRAPRVSILSVLIACSLIAFALVAKPGGYQIDQVPEVFFRVVGRYF